MRIAAHSGGCAFPSTTRVDPLSPFPRVIFRLSVGGALVALRAHQQSRGRVPDTDPGAEGATPPRNLSGTRTAWPWALWKAVPFGFRRFSGGVRPGLTDGENPFRVSAAPG
ncbi:hypothetical protein GCM10023205_57740 [Yinghuangia aomiensis]|uniref:Uncharacterized protein n=1 Tax=Yinghuangia aomiensis TaxID=676205 RepID=A0ABP9HX50_9ACTN